jgi:hypothetical protein
MPTPPSQTRQNRENRLLLTLLLIGSLHTTAQSNWHSGFGLTSGTLNFQQNGSGGFAIPLRYDVAKNFNNSLSLGTNLQIGSEDRYGIGFPLILALVALSYADGGAPQGDFPGNLHGKNGTAVCLFSQIPLLIDYNWGLGSNNYCSEPFGFYLGAGTSFTLTGYTNSAGNEHSTSFFGWVGHAGIRFARNLDLGFSATIPFTQPVGPIRHPLFYQLTLTFFNKD